MQLPGIVPFIMKMVPKITLISHKYFNFYTSLVSLDLLTTSSSTN